MTGGQMHFGGLAVYIFFFFGGFLLNILVEEKISR